MSNYETEKGQTVIATASDPANPTEGQIWYNSTSATAKVRTYVTPAWASGGDLNVGRRGAKGNGVRTAALHVGGFNPGFFANGKTESYDGTAFTAENDQVNPSGPLGGSFSQAPQGTAVSFGAQPGPNSKQTQLWDGTCWALGNNMQVGVQKSWGMGTRDAGLAAGGFSYDGVNPGAGNYSQEYDGTSWANGNTMGTHVNSHAGGGSQTAAWVAGYVTNVFEYDGTCWSNVPGVGPNQQGMGGAGPQTDGLVFGGQPAITTTSFYDGTSFTTGPTMSLARSNGGAASGTGQGSALAVGNGPNVVTTEELDGGFQTQTITSS